MSSGKKVSFKSNFKNKPILDLSIKEFFIEAYRKIIQLYIEARDIILTYRNTPQEFSDTLSQLVHLLENGKSKVYFGLFLVLIATIGFYLNI